MIRFILNVLLTALAFSFLMPLLGGIHFSGSFGNAIVYSLLLGLVSIVVNIALLAATAAFGIATAGAGAVLMFFLYLLGFWLIPAIQLEVLAWWFPKHLQIDSFGYAILGSLILMVINFLTKAPKKS